MPELTIGDYAPWVGFSIVVLTFAWRMAALRLEVKKHHDDKLGGYADRIERRLEHCEQDRAEQAQANAELRLQVLQQEVEINALQVAVEKMENG